jgi:uncharacterized protein (TIGR03083 family)
VEPAAFIDHVKVDAAAVLEAGKRSPSAPVPSCPDWRTADIVGHLGGAYWWVEAMVRTRATDVGAFASTPDDFDALCVWYDEGLSALVVALEQVGPDEPVWNWSVMGPGPARFWHRRMAHECSVHRWDIERAVGVSHRIDVDLAADGIDEYLGIAAFWLALTPRPGLAGTLGLVATDADVATTLTLAPDHLEHHGGVDHPDATVRAGASDLMLWLVGRLDSASDALVVEGDPEVARAWSSVSFG